MRILKIIYAMVGNWKYLKGLTSLQDMIRTIGWLKSLEKRLMNGLTTSMVIFYRIFIQS